MKRLALGLVLAVTAFAASAGTRNVTDPNAPRSLPEDGPVSISWDDPSKFSDLRYSGNRWEAERGDWVQQLASYLRKRANAQLMPGEKLEIRITDIERAGRYEPWRGINVDHVRFVRDQYPPRMELSYTLYAADGQVLAQAEQRKISDLGFLQGSTRLNNTDPLRYEKAMIDDWVRRDLNSTRVASER